MRAVRSFFFARGFLEVQTPTRTPTIAPEEHIDAIESETWYLSTSPELYMKQLLAAGYGPIFQCTPCFRKGERGRYHLPEFTILEWYRTFEDYRGLMKDCEDLIASVAQELTSFPTLRYQDRCVDLTCPWPRLRVREAFLRFAGWDPIKTPDPDRFDIDLVEKVEPRLDRSRPVFLEEYPAYQSSLATLKNAEPEVAERFELFIGGLELANGFTELRDASEQRVRFERANLQRAASGGIPYPLPESFMEVMDKIPPASGIALGVDRLIMLFTNAATIDEVVAFPLHSA